MYRGVLDRCTDHLRYLILGITTTIALGWVAKNTLMET